MTALVWDEIDKRTYEAGVHNGVLYDDSGLVSVWNGLISVNESETESDVEEIFFDSRKISNQKTRGFYEAEVSAFSFPDEFHPCLGLVSPRPGFILTSQEKKLFNFTYKTLVNEEDYKIHLVYNALATRSNYSYSTITDEANPTTFSWKIKTIPPKGQTFRSSSHFLVDSTKVDPESLVVLEEMLYGTDLDDPQFPTQAELIAIFGP